MRPGNTRQVAWVVSGLYYYVEYTYLRTRLGLGKVRTTRTTTHAHTHTKKHVYAPALAPSLASSPQPEREWLLPGAVPPAALCSIPPARWRHTARLGS